VAQVDGHRTKTGAWLSAVVGQRLGLALQHLGQVDLVDDGAVWPRQSVSAGIQTGGQDHRLTDTSLGPGDAVRVEKWVRTTW
jgi:hypothetical protein